MTRPENASTASKFRLDVAVDHWPLKQPFVITGHRFDKSPIVTATISDGVHSGRGEASGIYYKGDTPDRIIATIERVRSRIEAGLTRTDLQSVLPPGGARNALDCALWDLEAAISGQPAWALAGLETARPLLTTWTIGAAAADVMAATALDYGDARAIKLKLLGDAADGARVRAVRDARPDVWLGVDANQGFTAETLDSLWPTLIDCGVELVEQPFPIGSDALLEGRDRSIPFAADESLQSLADLERVGGLYDVVNIKLDKCGGLTEGLAIAWQARDMGLKVMVGNMTGSSLGMAPALVLGQLCDIVDLDGPIFLSRDHVPGVNYLDGRIHIRQPLWGAVTTTAAVSAT